MKANQLKILSVLFIQIYLLSCSHAQKKTNPQAKKLNDSAMNIVYQSSNLGDKKIAEAAMSLLNKATVIDSDYYTAYWNKVSLQIELGQYGDALKTAKQLLRLKPDSVHVIAIAGQCYDRTGDTLSASRCYKSALSKYNKMLDTMNIRSKDYISIGLGKAIDLILLNHLEECHILLNELSIKDTVAADKHLYIQLASYTKSDILYGKGHSTK